MAYIGNKASGTIEYVSANVAIASRFQASSSFTATVMGLGVYNNFDSGENLKLAIYDDSSGSPGNLLGQTSEIDGVSSIYLYNFNAELTSSVSITSGNYYWLVILSDSDFGAMSGSGTSAKAPMSYSTGFSDPFGTPIGGSAELNIWASDGDGFIRDNTLYRGGTVVTGSDGTSYVLSAGDYQVYIDSIDANELPQTVGYANQTNMFGGGTVGYIDAAVDSNDVIHVVAACAADQTRDIAYNTFTISTSSWGTWEEVAGYTEQVPTNIRVSISIDSGDEPGVLYVDSVKDAGSTQDNVYYTHRTSGSWDTPTQVGVRATKTDYHRYPKLTFRNSDYIEAAYIKNVSSFLHRSNTGTWGSETTWSTSSDTPLGLTSTTSGTVYRYGRQYPSEYIIENDSILSTAYSLYVAGYDGAASPSFDGSARYVFYVDTTRDIALFSNPGSGWTNEGALHTGTFNRVIAEWAYNNENQSGEINYIYDDGTNVYYDSYSLVSTTSDSITADAYIATGGTTDSITADAIIEKAVSQSISADAAIEKSKSFSFTADAAFVQTVEESITADAIIFKSASQSITSDAVIEKPVEQSFTADASIVSTVEDSVTADATILSAIEQSVISYATIKTSVSNSVSADSIIKSSVGQQFSADATIVVSNSDSVLADATIKASISESISADATIENSIEQSFTADAYIAGAVTQDITVDAIILGTISDSVSADAVVESSTSDSVTADAIVLSSVESSITSDATIESSLSDTFTADAEIVEVGNPVWVSPADTVTISSTPVLVFTMPESVGNMHFYMQLDTADTFDTGNLREYDSSQSQANWEYWNNSDWVAVPSGGVSNIYSGNDCRYTITSPLSATTWYRRVRGGLVL